MLYLSVSGSTTEELSTTEGSTTEGVILSTGSSTYYFRDSRKNNYVVIYINEINVFTNFSSTSVVHYLKSQTVLQAT